MGMEAAQGIAGFLSGFGQRYGEIEDRRMRQDQIDMQRQGIDLQKQTAADDRAFRQRQYDDLKAARDRDYSRQQTMDARTEEQYQSKLITANLVRDLYEKPDKADEIGPTLAFHATRAGMNVSDVNNWLKEVKGVRDTGLGDAFKDAYTMNYEGAIAKQNKVADKFGTPRWKNISGDPKSGFVFTYDDGRQEEVKPFDAAIRMTSYGYNPQKLIEQAQSATSPEKRKGQAVDLGDRIEFRDPETGGMIGEPMQKGIPAGKEPREVETVGDKRLAEATAKKIELNDKRIAQLQDIEMPQVSSTLQQAMSSGDDKATAQVTQQLRLLRSRIDNLNKERDLLMESLNSDGRGIQAGGGQRQASQPSGLIEPGNIDLNNRPVVQNADGTISTVRSISVGFGNKTVLLPTVSEDGRIMSDDEAVDQFKKTGAHLGVFSNEKAANRYAVDLHNQQAEMYGGGKRQGFPAGAAPQQAQQTDAANQKLAKIQGGAKMLGAISGYKPPQGIGATTEQQQPLPTNPTLSKYLDLVTGSLPDQEFTGNIGGSTIPASVGNPLIGAVKGIGYAKSGYNNSDASFSQKVAELRNNPVFIQWLEARQRQNPRLPPNANDLVAEFMQSIRSAK